MTTRKTNTIATKQPGPAELSQAALAEAHATAIGCEGVHQDAQELASQLRTGLLGGDDTISALELATAIADVERTDLLMQWSQKELRKAEAALINDDSRLADLLADVIADAFGGLVPVKVVTIRRDVAPNESGEPVLFLLQEKPTTDNGGILSGELRATFYRPALLTPLNADRLQQAATKRGYLVQVLPGSSSKRGDYYEDTARLRVQGAAHDVPILAAAPSAEAVRYFAQGMPGRLANAVRTTPTGIYVQGEAPAPNAKAEFVSHRVLDTIKADDGQRMTVQASYRVTPSPALKADPGPLMHAAVTDLGGTVEPRVGRIVAVEDVSITAPDQDAPGYRRPWTVNARFVVAFAVAG